MKHQTQRVPRRVRATVPMETGERASRAYDRALGKIKPVPNDLRLQRATSHPSALQRVMEQCARMHEMGATRANLAALENTLRAFCDDLYATEMPRIDMLALEVAENAALVRLCEIAVMTSPNNPSALRRYSDALVADSASEYEAARVASFLARSLEASHA